MKPVIFITREQYKSINKKLLNELVKYYTIFINNPLQIKEIKDN